MLSRGDALRSVWSAMVMPEIQRNKLKALGLASCSSTSWCSPTSWAASTASRARFPCSRRSPRLGVDGRAMPSSSAIAPRETSPRRPRQGCASIRVRTGKYARFPTIRGPWRPHPTPSRPSDGLLELSGQRPERNDLVDDAVVAGEPGDAVVVRVAAALDVEDPHALARRRDTDPSATFLGAGARHASGGRRNARTVSKCSGSEKSTSAGATTT